MGAAVGRQELQSQCKHCGKTVVLRYISAGDTWIWVHWSILSTMDAYAACKNVTVNGVPATATPVGTQFRRIEYVDNISD